MLDEIRRKAALEKMDSEAGVERWSRDIRPAHFIFRIRSFSLLLETDVDKYESGVFQACDKKWKLCIYPKGNKKEDGDNHISLYLQIAETDKLPQGWEVHAKFSLFVFDHVRDRYLTIQDAGGKVRRLHNMKTEWGFDQLLPWSTFKDPLNGYLVDDTCAFGAEILVVSNTAKCECLSMVKDLNNTTYTWKINDFTSKTNDFIFSDQFINGGSNWKLKLYPNGAGSEIGKSLSLYLVSDDIAILTTHAGKLYAKAKLRVRNQFKGEHHEKQGEYLFDGPEFRSRGYRSFMPLKMLESVQGFLVDNTLILEAEILLLSKLSVF